jgi:hypothetical protein
MSCLGLCCALRNLISQLGIEFRSSNFDAFRSGAGHTGPGALADFLRLERRQQRKQDVADQFVISREMRLGIASAARASCRRCSAVSKSQWHTLGLSSRIAPTYNFPLCSSYLFVQLSYSPSDAPTFIEITLCAHVCPRAVLCHSINKKSIF